MPKPTREPDPTAPPVPFMEPVPKETAKPGDLAFFHNKQGAGGSHGYRLGVVAPYTKKKMPKESIAIRLRRPGGRLGPTQVVPLADVLHVYRDSVMHDPTEDAL